MRVGFVGLGKLGLPCALAAESRGHDVKGYDVSADVIERVWKRRLAYREDGAEELLKASRLEIVTLQGLVEWAELIFVAVQTPHAVEYEGITRLPAERVDFDYTYLREAMKEVSEAIGILGEPRPVAIVSTVLPGTIEREIMPLLHPDVKLSYNPSFIAMGTVIQDYLDPEFVLLGGEVAVIEDFYRTLHARPIYKTSIINAEAIKVFYNTFISTKLAFANTVMEVCHKLGADCDEVMGALKIAGDRIISGRYMDGGMGDGGGCHPRDNIALSSLSRKLHLSFDWFESIMRAREAQTEWLAEMIWKQWSPGQSVVLLGKAFKAGTNIETGSPAILLRNLLAEKGISATMYDPEIDETQPEWADETIFFVSTRHEAFASMAFPRGSTVIDPWRYVEDQDGVLVIRIGGSR